MEGNLKPIIYTFGQSKPYKVLTSEQTSVSPIGEASCSSPTDTEFKIPPTSNKDVKWKKCWRCDGSGAIGIRCDCCGGSGHEPKRSR